MIMENLWEPFSINIQVFYKAYILYIGSLTFDSVIVDIHLKLSCWKETKSSSTKILTLKLCIKCRITWDHRPHAFNFCKTKYTVLCIFSKSWTRQMIGIHSKRKPLKLPNLLLELVHLPSWGQGLCLLNQFCWILLDFENGALLNIVETQ